MNNEYIIEVGLNKHEHDNPKNPFFWSIQKFNTEWCNEKFGWSKTPYEAFSDALDYYNENLKKD